MKNLPPFLSGCVSGMLITFVIYCVTMYFATQDVEFSRVRSELDGASTVEDSTTKPAPLSSSSSSSSSLPPLVPLLVGSDGSSLHIEEDSHTLPPLVQGKRPHVVTGEKMLMSVVISSTQQIYNTIHVVENTWGQSAEGFGWKVAMGTKGNSMISNTDRRLFMARDCYNFPSSTHLTPGQLFCLVVSIYNSILISQYQWFSISLNSTYIATEDLMHLLHQYNSKDIVYLGQTASFTSTERTMLKLKRSEKICSAGTGIILSRKAVESISPHLRHCLGLGSSVKALPHRKAAIGDVELGRCFNRMLKTSCCELLSHKTNPSSLFVSQADHLRTLESFLTYYPLKTEDEMLSMRFYDLSRKMRALQRKEEKISKSAERICSSLPHPASLGNDSNLCNLTVARGDETIAPRLYLPRTQPSRLDELVRWELYTDNRLFNSEKLNPVMTPTPSLRKEIKFIFDKILDFIGGTSRFNPINVHNMYFRHVGSLGREYILDVEFREKKTVSKERRISLLLPSIGDLVFVDANEPQFVSKIIEFIVPVSNVNSRFTQFLKMYTDLCLATRENCHLNLVVYGDRDYRAIGRTVRFLKRRYRRAKLLVIKGSGQFSRGRALEIGLAALPNTSLIFICDVDMVIERTFLRRCQRNAIPGKRVYYPEFFKYYNMDYVYRFSKQPHGASIIRQHGHWATYSYGMLCIYKSDFIMIGGFDDIEGWGGEDVLLAESVAKNRLDLFRAPDPALSHRYHDKKCSAKLNPKQFASCISSRNENLADRTRLAEYVFYLEGHCNVKQWNLWSWS